jgi:TonB family protein
MKSLITILLLVNASILCSAQEQQKDSLAGENKNSLTTVCYFPPEPKIIYKPEIITPKELKSIKKKVKVWVKTLLDTTGKTSNYKIVKSSDSRFNKTAIQFTKMYKFEYPDSDKKKFKVWLTIPIIFNQ